VTYFLLLSLKNDGNVPSKSTGTQKAETLFKTKLVFVGVLKVYDEDSRILIH
jgi:hypothetical protein